VREVVALDLSETDWEEIGAIFSDGGPGRR